MRSAAVRTPAFMYAEHDTRGGPAPDEFELYDMRADPYQLRNRYGDPGLESITSKLEERLDQLRDCAGGECR